MDVTKEVEAAQKEFEQSIECAGIAHKKYTELLDNVETAREYGDDELAEDLAAKIAVADEWCWKFIAQAKEANAKIKQLSEQQKTGNAK